MKRFRLRLSVLLWLVAIAAAFLAGVRYGEYRAGLRRPVGSMVRAIDRTLPAKPINSHAGFYTACPNKQGLGKAEGA
jgi:hypothetical protein